MPNRMQRVLSTAGLTLLGLAAVNRLVGKSRPLVSPLAGEEHDLTTPHGRIHYSKLGSGPPLLMLHGVYAGAWRYEVRRIAERMSGSYTVYVPDLLGFGQSERPAISYTPEIYVDVIESLIEQAIGRETPIFASSLSAAFAMVLAQRRPELVGDLIFVCPAGIEQLASPAQPPEMLVGGFMRLPIVGEAFYHGLVSRAGLRYYLERQSYFDRSLVTDEMIDAYYASSHQPGARWAPAAFIGGQLNCNVGNIYPYLTQRILVIWGRDAKISPLWHIDEFRRLRPTSDFEVVDRCGALVHDEQLDACYNIIRNWLSLGVTSQTEFVRPDATSPASQRQTSSRRQQAVERSRTSSSRSPDLPAAGDTSDRPAEPPTPDPGHPA